MTFNLYSCLRCDRLPARLLIRIRNSKRLIMLPPIVIHKVHYHRILLYRLRRCSELIKSVSLTAAKVNQTGVARTHNKKKSQRRLIFSVLPVFTSFCVITPGELGQCALLTNFISCVTTKERIKNLRCASFCARVNESNILVAENQLNRLIIRLGELRKHTKIF